ncbi:hypothetical protein F5B19DRAFT_487767 [Rostrohypoxylon terebratum]|nr:hypothetical protein F5B19DRAFT_487767 [Rostrohypoxylon terebratum]
MDDDSRDHLLRISVRHQQPIINLLLDIQQKKEQRTEASSKFLDELECFYIGIGKSGKTKLFREWIRVSREPNYLALSYTWSPSKDEESTKGGYLVQNRNRSRFYSSGVRDCVLGRITKYMKHKDVQLLWVNRHNIPQQNCKDPQCECGPCKKKAAALRSMDWVYKKSNHPVALLGRPITTKKFASDPQSMWFTGWKKMILLIPHPQPLEDHKLRCKLFGDVPGELCIQSIWAGRYKELLDKSEPMDPAIIADTERRGVKEPWDRLSIVANCCDYPVRLAEQQLRHNGCSLSLSMLAMCLLNGLILHNGASSDKAAFEMTIPKFLEARCFNKFLSPPGQPSLTFNKGCRFINVELSKAGIGTQGHLWSLGPVIDTGTIDNEPPWVENPRDDLTLLAQQRLTQLSCRLRSLSHKRLAEWIEAYLRRDTVGDDPYQFVGDYMLMMADTVASAIKEKKPLRLGRLRDAKGARGENVPYTAIFETGTDGYYINDTDRYVSLHVRSDEDQANGSVTYLYTKRWLPGLCFFKGYPRKEVIFPWPQALMDIKPDL